MGRAVRELRPRGPARSGCSGGLTPAEDCSPYRSDLLTRLFQHVLRCLKILFQVGVYLAAWGRPPTFVGTLGYHRAICPISLPVPNLEGPGFSRASQRATQDLAQSGPWLPWPLTRTEHAPCLCAQSDRGPCLGARGVSLGRPWTAGLMGPPLRTRKKRQWQERVGKWSLGSCPSPDQALAQMVAGLSPSPRLVKMKSLGLGG
nr:uncharacterized protein LOC112932246 [Vulpes vulpes]